MQKKETKVLTIAVIVLALGAMFMIANWNKKPGQSIQEGDGGTEQMPVEQEAYVDKMDRSDEGFKLVWNDEFDGDSLDTTKWDYQYGTGSEYGLDGWGNSELEYYTDRTENVRVEDGKLLITAIKEESLYEGKEYTSGRIRTMTKDDEEIFSTTYGRIEARIKMPAGEGLWPAFWMLPVDETIYGGWAASGEIDIMEARGRLPEVAEGTLHYGKVWPNNTYKGGGYTFSGGTDITDFHVYSLEWEPTEIRWYVDDECFYSMDKWFSQGKYGAAEYTAPAPFDVPFYILLDLAVGGTFDSAADLSKAEFPATMEVDFVRVYHKEEGYETAGDSDVEIADNRDTEGFAQYAASYEDKEFIVDKEFTTMNTEAITDTDKGVVADSKDWQFAVGNFGGAATAAVEELEEGTFARIDSTAGGNQTYAVQLIQHFPVIEGYTYLVSFDAKASGQRTFIVSPSGDGDNGWAKYSSYNASVGTDVTNMSFTFKMNNTTDPTARLEFNVGQAIGSLWIGNVSVTVLETEGGVDNDMKKTPLADGNLIYNGTFDQGAKRLAFWHVEDMEAVIEDYITNSNGKKNFDRMAELTASGENPRMYQTGLPVDAGKKYYVRLDLKGQEAADVRVTITGEDGTVFFDETCNYEAGGKKQKFELHFENAGDVSAENAVLTISLPSGQSVWIDNVKFKAV